MRFSFPPDLRQCVDMTSLRLLFQVCSCVPLLLPACGVDTQKPAPPPLEDSEVAVPSDTSSDDSSGSKDATDTTPGEDSTSPPLDSSPEDSLETSDAPAETTDTSLDLLEDTSPIDTFDTTPPPEEPPCPRIGIEEGLEVSPPLRLHLSGLETTGTASAWEWALESGPNGLTSAFLPSPNVPEPTFEAALAGTYVFRLAARNNAGASACPPATLTVRAIPTSAVHLELVWNDNTENPSAPIGADLDLHVLHMTHPDATGLSVDGDTSPDVWFDPTYDCAWHNPDATWTPGDTPETPTRCRLLRRDDAGYGPEVIALDHLAPETVYSVGFHVWDDTDTVYLAPTEIRIWIDGVLKNKPSFAVPVKANDLWRVMTVKYPSGVLGFPFEKDASFLPASPTK
jgi:hypothetical protein